MSHCELDRVLNRGEQARVDSLEEQADEVALTELTGVYSQVGWARVYW